MSLRDDAEALVRAHREAAEAAPRAPWEDPVVPDWCVELAAALWESSYRPQPVYYRVDAPPQAWRGPHPLRMHHLGFGWQLTAHADLDGRSAAETIVVLEDGSIWEGLGVGHRPPRGPFGRRDTDGVDGFLAVHDTHYAVRRLTRPSPSGLDRRLLFGVAGLAALIEDTVRLGPHGVLDWTL